MPKVVKTYQFLVCSFLDPLNLPHLPLAIIVGLDSICQGTIPQTWGENTSNPHVCLLLLTAAAKWVRSATHPKRVVTPAQHISVKKSPAIQ